MKALALLCSLPLVLLAGQPQLQSLRVTIDPFVVPAGSSNAVVIVNKSTSLGTVWTPFKPTAIFPADRTNTIISVLPGLYRFHCTAQVTPSAECVPSNVVTNNVP